MRSTDRGRFTAALLSVQKLAVCLPSHLKRKEVSPREERAFMMLNVVLVHQKTRTGRLRLSNGGGQHAERTHG